MQERAPVYLEGVTAGSWKAAAAPQIPFKGDWKALDGCSYTIHMLSIDDGARGNE